MRSLERICVLTALALGVALATLKADEEKIPLDKVPKAVVSAFKAKFPGATIKNAIKEDEDGKTVYEIESTLKGLGIDAVLKPNGDFVEIEREIKATDLPKAVTAAVEAKHPKSKVTKAEEVTKGTEVYYEATVQKADGKTAEVAVNKDGKIRD